MKEEELAILEREVHEASKAKVAYDSYLETFFEEERLNIFNRFCNSDMDSDTLLNVKHAQMALDNLEQAVLTVIDSGKMANRSLQNYNKEI